MSAVVLIAICSIAAALISHLNRKGYFWQKRSSSKKTRLHQKNIKQSYDLIKRLRTWQGPGLEARIIKYLRRINALVFEELVLSCLQDVGAKIKRNRRYTGDGGVDGIFFLNGVQWLVQAKCYSSAIEPQHVKDFVSICNGQPGLFVHTGRTGPKSYAHVTPNIKIISGQRLIRLIFNDRFQEQLGR